MTRRNFFISYHHRSDFPYLQQLREVLKDRAIKDYGFRDLDLGENSKQSIAKEIQNRIWASSITVVLVGEMTGKSDWVDWEIWYSLRNLKGIGPSRRIFKPKGLIALFLPETQHLVPQRLQDNLDSGYALKLDWKDLQTNFYSSLEKAAEKRNSLELIRNLRKPNIQP